MNNLSEAIHDYCEKLSLNPDPILRDIDRATHLETLAPRMLSGSLQGAFLTLISKMVNPKVILEIGTFTGYSAICLAHGLAQNGHLITIEYNPEHAFIAERFFNQSSMNDRIRLIQGDAKAIIPTLDSTFDLVFIDADKEGYSVYFDLVIDKCRPGAVILVDNVLWDGKVIDPNPDKKTKIIQDFNKKIAADTRVESMILPLRDGIQLIRKK
ncbi:MAG: O-methyltransferase [Chitinophagales bacterium]|nr:O-methyltransferase [Chitinophagales bacterium]